MNQFTADASHDLRTPLALIRTNAELALRRNRSETEYRETLARILTSSEETTELIEKLLMLARADAGASQLTYQVVELGVTVLRASRKAQVLALSKGVVFFENMSNTPMFVKADHSAIETLLLSLLDNAVKYTASGGQVFLRSRQEDGFALIEVEDTGIGIADIDLPKIFNRFFRADQARSREIRGSGLGLSIAQWIAEIHNGTIAVKSELGRGSLFTVRLPLTIAPATNQIPEVINQPSTVAPH
jgi:signal transduction histidine kinase